VESQVIFHDEDTNTFMPGMATRYDSMYLYLDRIGKCIFPIPKALIHQG
jgi:hypothetical protein